MKVDLHVCTHPGTATAIPNPEEAIQAARSRGMDGVALADERGLVPWAFHDLQVLGEYHGVKVFPAWKVPSTFGDLILYQPSIDPSGIRDFKRPVEVLALIEWAHGRGMAVVVPHLFRGMAPSMARSVVEDGTCDWWVRLCDGLEQTWATDRKDDGLVERLARNLSKPVTGGSGAHHEKHVGRGYTVFPDSVVDAAGLVDHILEGKLEAS